MKAPQERATPKTFKHVLPYARASADEEGVAFGYRYEGDTRYSSAFSLEGRAGVEELRDYLNAWLEADEQEADR